MFGKERRIYSIILLSTMVLTLVIAYTLENFIGTILIVIMVLAQYAALFWYLVLLVPGGKKVVCACFKCIKEQATDKE